MGGHKNEHIVLAQGGPERIDGSGCRLRSFSQVPPRRPASSVARDPGEPYGQLQSGDFPDRSPKKATPTCPQKQHVVRLEEPHKATTRIVKKRRLGNPGGQQIGGIADRMIPANEEMLATNLLFPIVGEGDPVILTNRDHCSAGRPNFGFGIAIVNAQFVRRC